MEYSAPKSLYHKNLLDTLRLLDQVLDAISTMEYRREEWVSNRRQVVQLFIRAAEAYWAHSTPNTDFDELLGYIAYAAERVEKALPTAVVSPMAKSTPDVFSEDSILRQLCYLVPTRASEVTFDEESDDDTETVLTDPFLLGSGSSLFTPDTTRCASTLPRVKTYFDGRDNWDCDFCGPECFCFGLPE